MSNVFQQQIGGAGPQAGPLPTPFVAPSAQPRDRSGEILDIMAGASRIAGAFMDRSAAQQAAQADAETHAAMGDFYTGLIALEGERSAFEASMGEVSTGVYNILGDDSMSATEKESLLVAYQDQLEDIRGAFSEAAMSPYHYSAAIARMQSDMISRHPELRQEILSVGGKFSTSQQPSTEASNRAATLQNNHMSQRYGANWNVADLAYETSRVRQTEELVHVRERIELGGVQASQIGTAAVTTANAHATDLVNRYYTQFQQNGALTADDIAEFRNEWANLQSVVTQEALGAVDAASTKGTIIDRDARNNMLNDINSVFTTLMPSDLDDMEFTKRLGQIQEAERMFIEHNVPQLPFIRLMGELGGDTVLSQLTAMNRFMGSGANLDRIEGLLDDPTFAMSQSIQQGLTHMLYLSENREVFREQLGPAQRRLYDSVTLEMNRSTTATPGQAAEAARSITETVEQASSADAPRSVNAAMRYLSSPNVIQNAQQSPEEYRRSLATTGRRLINDITPVTAYLPALEALEQGDRQPVLDALGSRPLAQIEEYLNLLDKYHDAGIGGGRQEFFDMARADVERRDSEFAARQQAREASRAERTANSDPFREIGMNEEQSRLMATFMSADPRRIDARTHRVARSAAEGMGYDGDTDINSLRQFFQQRTEQPQGLTEEELSAEPTSTIEPISIQQMLRQGMRPHQIAEELGVDGAVLEAVLARI